MSFKKKILAALMTLIFAIGLCACSSTSATTSKNDMFTDRDYDTSYDESSATKITLSDDGSKVDGDGASVSNEIITISEEGTYILSGELSDGQIIVDADESAKIQIVLDNVSITNDTSSTIYVKTAKKVFFTMAEGSNNTLKTTSSYEAVDESNIDGVVFAKSDITFNGEGTLTIEAAYGHGVVSKDDLRFTSGTYNITGAEHALQGKDSVRIGGGTLNLTAGEDGVHSENSEKVSDGKGFVYVCDGNLNISAGDDGIHGGVYVMIDGGTIDVSKSYEGIEAQSITINDGSVDVTSSDDGMNAATGETTNENDPMAVDESCSLIINGGTIHVNAEGDGLDSNGAFEVNGGIIYIDGPTTGANGALDSSGDSTISGGTIIALGSSGMAENFKTANGQGSMLIGISGNAGDVITVTDSSGSEIISYTATKSYQCAVISSPDIREGETYTITYGSSSTNVTMNSSIVSNVAGGMGGQGGFGGAKDEMGGPR